MMGYNPADSDDFLTGYGYLGGQPLQGTQDINSEVSTAKQSPSQVTTNSPGLYSIPFFLGKFVKQVNVMLTPKRIFVPETLPDFSPYYQQSNHPQNQPSLVFQSPLEYIGLPNQGG